MSGRGTPPQVAPPAPTAREAAVLERIEAFRRRRPRLAEDVVTMAHGAGGKSSAALLEAVFLPAFAEPGGDGRGGNGGGGNGGVGGGVARVPGAADLAAALRPELGDAAVIALPSGERLAVSTDSFVVRPLRFPGGSIGHLAVHGTVNDLAVTGARPLALAAAFVLE